MKLTYRIDKKDQSAFMWHYFWRSSTTWRPCSVVLILGMLGMSFDFYKRGADFQSSVTFIAGYVLLMVLVFFVSGYFMIKSSVRRNCSGDNNGLIGDLCLTVDDTGVSEQSGPVEIRVKWIGIHKVSVAEAHAFIFYNPQTAFIVPKRAFAEESDFNEFVRDCVSRLPEHTLNPRLDHARP
jgi:YcxB-like protein